jgi:hypothetical protein
MEASSCRLCGAASEILTLEHIPPKSTGNRGVGELEMFTATPQGRVRRSVPDGVAVRVLCKRCNNTFGSKLGTGFGEFAKQIRESGRLESPSGGAFVSAVDIFPARIVRQLLLCFLCAQPHDNREGWDDIRLFIRSREPGLPSSAPRISLYYNAADSYRIVPVCSVGAIDGSHRNWVGSEIAAPGLGVIFSLPGSDSLGAARLIGKSPVEISSWADYPFGRRESLVLTLPRLRVEEPHPIGFGRPRDFERWQTSNMIVWLVAQTDYPDSVTATAVLWRQSRRRKR